MPANRAGAELASTFLPVEPPGHWDTRLASQTNSAIPAAIR
jgi:hypothetical protein